MRSKVRLTVLVAGVVLVAVGTGCGDTKPAVQLTGPRAPSAAASSEPRPALGGRVATLQELRDRNPSRWAGDSVQSVIRGYRTDYLARRKAKLPLKGVCEGLFDYFTKRNSWGRSLGISGGKLAELLNPKCGGATRKLRFMSAAFSGKSGEEDSYVTTRSMALLDSLQVITDRVDAADRSASEAVAMLTSEIGRIETLAANASLSNHEYELVETTISGLTATIAESQSMVPAIMQEIVASIDACTQRLGFTPSDPADCDKEIYEVFGPMSSQLPRPVLMCAIALNAPSMASPLPRNSCDGHQIIEGMAKGFIGGAVSGAWAGLVTGGLGVPLTALLGGIGGATSGLAVGLAQSFWCEWTK